jgi:hypothetical protein
MGGRGDSAIQAQVERRLLGHRPFSGKRIIGVAMRCAKCAVISGHQAKAPSAHPPELGQTWDIPRVPFPLGFLYRIVGRGGSFLGKLASVAGKAPGPALSAPDAS